MQKEAPQRATLGVSLQGYIQNYGIHAQTNVTDIARRTARHVVVAGARSQKFKLMIDGVKRSPSGVHMPEVSVPSNKFERRLGNGHGNAMDPGSTGPVCSAILGNGLPAVDVFRLVR